MDVSKIEERVREIDVEAAGVRGFVASYILSGEKTAIVETGPKSSIPKLLKDLKSLRVEAEDVDYIFVSHIHLDHAGGVGTLIKHLPKAKVVVHQKGVPHLAKPEILWQQSKATLGRIAELYGKPEPVPCERIVEAYDGMSIDLDGDFKITVLETPGHASHHLSFYEPLGGRIFTGDAAGMYLKDLDVVFPTTPPPFRLDLAFASLEKLAGLKPKVLHYTHFGIAYDANQKIKFYAQQLRLWAEIAKESIESGLSLSQAELKVVEKDEAAGKAVEYFKSRGVLGENVLSISLKGIIDFVKNFGSPFQA
jgi:glyoxylase-like metal-dependent hydrolase (beta-lactamase superfamily II)